MRASAHEVPDRLPIRYGKSAFYEEDI